MTAIAQMLMGHTVLIVEDEPLVAWELSLMVTDRGGAVVGPASTAVQALSLLGDEVSLAVLDVRLGNHDVGPVAEELKRRQIPFLFQTGHADHALLPRWGDVPIIKKPAPPETIAHELLRLLGR